MRIILNDLDSGIVVIDNFLSKEDKMSLLDINVSDITEEIDFYQYHDNEHIQKLNKIVGMDFETVEDVDKQRQWLRKYDTHHYNVFQHFHHDKKRYSGCQIRVVNIIKDTSEESFFEYKDARNKTKMIKSQANRTIIIFADKLLHRVCIKFSKPDQERICYMQDYTTSKDRDLEAHINLLWDNIWWNYIRKFVQSDVLFTKCMKQKR